MPDPDALDGFRQHFPTRDEVDERLRDLAALQAAQSRKLDEDHEPRIQSNTARHDLRDRAEAARPASAPAGLIPSTIYTAGQTAKDFTGLSDKAFRRIVWLVLLAVLVLVSLGFMFALRNATIHIGGTTVERQTVQDQEVYGPEVRTAPRREGEPAPPPPPFSP